MSTKEMFISRKVIGFPLKVRREQFAGVGSETSFSQTNIEATASTTSEESNLAKRLVAPKLNRIKKSKLTRLALHASVIAAVVVVVGAGKMSASQDLINQTSSTKDQTSLIATGAMLAANTPSLLQKDVAQKAQDLTNLSGLTTAGDDFLAKKSPVMTAGLNRELSTYKVKDGDTLSSISQKFNITTDTVKWANGIADENQIKPGSSLTIMPVSGVLHTVKDGDDIVALAQYYQSNANLIENYNQLEGKGPTAGMKLIIPDGVIPAPVVAPSPVASVAITPSRTTSSGSYSFKGGANGYSYGYCTYYVANKRSIPGGLGNANQWPYNARAAGMTVSSTPRAGAAGVARYGNHVVYIESVSGGTVNYTEMNGPAGWNRVNSGSAPASNFTYIY